MFLCFLSFSYRFRYSLNSIAVIFIVFSVLFDTGVWYCVKDLKIFDDEEKHIKLVELKEKIDTTQSNQNNVKQVEIEKM